MSVGIGINELLKKLAGQKIEDEQPMATSTDLDDVAMQDDPEASYVVALRKKRKSAMLKRILQQTGDRDMLRNISVKERT